jgi:hypothetical protein
MSLKQQDTYEESIKERAEEAGLAFAGYTEDGEPEFIGTDKQWQEFRSNVRLYDERGLSNQDYAGQF